MPEHTPGPWSVDPRGWAKVWAPDAQGVNSGGICVAVCDNLPNGLSCQEEKANARLIAAVPDLLEALEDLLAWTNLSEYEKSRQKFQRGDLTKSHARAAIAKARGTQ